MTPETERAISQAFDRLRDAVIVMVKAMELETPVSVETLPAPEPESGNGKTGLLTVQEVAESLGVSESMAYTLAKRGEFPTVRLGRSVRVRPEDLQAYISAQVS